jgi:aminoglycoside 6'-N-acetyltransferase
MTVADVPDVERVLTAPEVARWWPIDVPEDVVALCDGRDPALKVWAIVADNVVQGVIQAWEESDPDHRHASIDLALHPLAQGRAWGRKRSGSWRVTCPMSAPTTA